MIKDKLLLHLTVMEDIGWARENAIHMDEYIGLTSPPLPLTVRLQV